MRYGKKVALVFDKEELIRLGEIIENREFDLTNPFYNDLRIYIRKGLRKFKK